MIVTTVHRAFKSVHSEQFYSIESIPLQNTNTNVVKVVQIWPIQAIRN